jgi:glycyl-tRNA synthetase
VSGSFVVALRAVLTRHDNIGCSVKNNLLAMWRQHFIVEEGMLELEATCLTPEAVLKASGHVEKFTDLMVKDVHTEECFRADHLLADHLDKMLTDPKSTPPLSEDERSVVIALQERIDEVGQEEMDMLFKKYGVVAPITGNPVTGAYPFNLMFQTQIGPTGLLKGYLRPETAQGIFVNFRRLIEYAGNKLPFACAQVGLSFRNEISPQAGLLRVREFMQAEIEHFVRPEDKNHVKFHTIADMTVSLYGRVQQLTTFEPVQIAIGEAVRTGTIDNETLGYFIARTNAFVQKMGMNMKYVRFRQHLEHEMAHYAKDCWDLEVRCSYKWVECAGLADRSAYDLSVHSEASKVELAAREVYAEVQEMEVLVCVPNKGLLGKSLKRDAQPVMEKLQSLSESECKSLQAEFKARDGRASVTVEKGTFEVADSQVDFKLEKRKISGRNFYPSVIEPSFGIGRLLYCLWEHVYYVRDGEREENAIPPAVLKLPPVMAPVKCAVLPLSKNEKFNDLISDLSSALSLAGLINRIDDGGQSIGRRYARADELGTPFGITVDFASLEDKSVTVRERDSTLQIRCGVEDAVRAIGDMVSERKTWKEVRSLYPAFSS